MFCIKFKRPAKNIEVDSDSEEAIEAAEAFLARSRSNTFTGQRSRSNTEPRSGGHKVCYRSTSNPEQKSPGNSNNYRQTRAGTFNDHIGVPEDTTHQRPRAHTFGDPNSIKDGNNGYGNQDCPYVDFADQLCNKLKSIENKGYIHSEERQKYKMNEITHFPSLEVSFGDKTPLIDAANHVRDMDYVTNEMSEIDEPANRGSPILFRRNAVWEEKEIERRALNRTVKDYIVKSYLENIHL